jgi:hypothetical protein
MGLGFNAGGFMEGLEVLGETRRPTPPAVREHLLEQHIVDLVQERDAMKGTLRDLIMGADMMIDAGLSMPDWVRRYINEVKRVAQGGLQP